MEKSVKEFKETVELLTALELLEAKQHYQSKLEPFDAYSTRIREQVLNKCLSSLDTLREGYQTILSHVSQDERPLFSVDDKVDARKKSRWPRIRYPRKGSTKSPWIYR